MHVEAFEHVARWAAGKRFGRVLEIGSLNINGTVRTLIDANSYMGIDLQPGLDVDEVIDAVDFRLPLDDRADAVVCCEVLEHAPDVEGVVASIAENLVTGGLFIITCATDLRAPHSGVDGGPLRDGEHYANVDPHLLAKTLGHYDLLIEDLEVAPQRGDLYVNGWLERER